MSKVEAYRCDYCNTIVEAEGIVGVQLIEDLFDKLKSYPASTAHPEREQVHHCLDCYRTIVLIPAANAVDRRTQERLYALKVAELHYGLRIDTVNRWRSRRKKVR